MADIKLTSIDKVYPGGAHAVHSVDLHIADGEFMIMVGPSGCAKSTILRMIAGLETPTGGTVEIGGRVVNDVAPKDRDIAMVFQSYALYPHMTVRENMAFGLKLRRMPPAEIDQRVGEAARILGLEHLLDRLPKAMSGGQRQRVAMGRAIVREPQAFLMDEPLSNLDAKLRVQMRTEIAQLHQRLGTTTVYVTHDQVEALTLGQRICILRAGVVQQVDTPYNVYENPANVFVGGFIGSPGMNFMRGVLRQRGSGAELDLGAQRVALPEHVAARLLEQPGGEREVIAGIRPEHLYPAAPGATNALPVHVSLVEAMGSEQYVYFTSGVSVPDLSELSDTQATSSTFTARLASSERVQAGHDAWLALDADRIHLFDPRTMRTLLAPVHEEGSDIVTLRPRIEQAHVVSAPTFELEVGQLPEIDTAAIATVFDRPVATSIDVCELEPVAVNAGPITPEPASVPRPSITTAPQIVTASRNVSEPSSVPAGFAPRPIAARRATPTPTPTRTLRTEHPDTIVVPPASEPEGDAAIDEHVVSEPHTTPRTTTASPFRAALQQLREPTMTKTAFQPPRIAVQAPSIRLATRASDERVDPEQEHGRHVEGHEQQ